MSFFLQPYPTQTPAKQIAAERRAIAAAQAPSTVEKHIPRKSANTQKEFVSLNLKPLNEATTPDPLATASRPPALNQTPASSSSTAPSFNGLQTMPAGALAKHFAQDTNLLSTQQFTPTTAPGSAAAKARGMQRRSLKDKHLTAAAILHILNSPSKSKKKGIDESQSQIIEEEPFDDQPPVSARSAGLPSLALNKVNVKPSSPFKQTRALHQRLLQQLEAEHDEEEDDDEQDDIDQQQNIEKLKNNISVSSISDIPQNTSISSDASEEKAREDISGIEQFMQQQKERLEKELDQSMSMNSKQLQQALQQGRDEDSIEDEDDENPVLPPTKSVPRPSFVPALNINAVNGSSKPAEQPIPKREEPKVTGAASSQPSNNKQQALSPSGLEVVEQLRELTRQRESLLEALNRLKLEEAKLLNALQENQRKTNVIWEVFNVPKQ